MVLLETNDNGGKVSVNAVEHKITGSSYNPSGSVDGVERDECGNLQDGAVKVSCDIMSLCNDARLIGNDKSTDDASNPSPQFTIEGEPTEAALAVVVEKLGPYPSDDPDKKPSELANQNKLHFINGWERYATLEFDRQRKSMSTLCTQQSNGRCRLLCKGAPNMILRRCTHAKLRDGTIVPLDHDLIDKIDATISSIGNRALRCIGLAYKDEKDLDPSLLKESNQYGRYLKDFSNHESIEDGMTFVGMVAIRDPPRPNVSHSGELKIM